MSKRRVNEEIEIRALERTAESSPGLGPNERDAAAQVLTVYEGLRVRLRESSAPLRARRRRSSTWRCSGVDRHAVAHLSAPDRAGSSSTLAEADRYGIVS
jgi:hypothetical protein